MVREDELMLVLVKMRKFKCAMPRSEAKPFRDANLGVGLCK